MFDPDWNPANDEQAMARVWRPGQDKKVFLYRLMSTGTIEEKKVQRQMAKLSLADTVMTGDVDGANEFDEKSTKALFDYKEDTLSETHDLLNCPCAPGSKKLPKHIRDRANVAMLSNWRHCYDPVALQDVHILQHH